MMIPALLALACPTTACLASVYPAIVASHAIPATAVWQGDGQEPASSQDPKGEAATTDPNADPDAKRVLQPMPLPLAVIPRVENGTMVCDGALLEWPALPSIRLDDYRQLSGTARGAFRNGQDLAARCFFVWDDDALWFSATVADDWHRPLAKAEDRQLHSEIPPADNFMLSFDPRRDTRAFGVDPGRKEDREVWLGDIEAGEGGEKSRQGVLWDRFRGSARQLGAQTCVLVRDAEKGLTVYEARIPWNEILPPGEVPHAERLIDMQIVLSDYDASTDPLAQTRIGWTFGVGAFIDPGLFGTAILLEKLDPDRGVPRVQPALDPEAVPWMPGQEWLEIAQALREHPPAVHDGSTTPEDAGGIERLRALELLEEELVKQPYLDNVEYMARIHRQMEREIAGMSLTGLPFYWHLVMAAQARTLAATDPPKKGLRIAKLPQGGWLFEQDKICIGVDIRTHDAPERLLSRLDAVLLTHPAEMLMRHDGLLMALSEQDPPKPFFTHVAFHLPTISIAEMPLVRLGEARYVERVKLEALGRPMEDGRVVAQSSWLLRFPDDTTVVLASPSFQEETLDAALARGERPDVLVLPVRHPHAPTVGQRVRAGITVIDDCLRPGRNGPKGRAPLDMAHYLQKALLPQHSILIAPGDVVMSDQIMKDR